LVSGYAFFLATGGIGLLVTMMLYAALLRFTSMDYVVARVLVSLVAGLIMFALNAVLNFRRL
jgi:putative flippase GtrA